LNGADLSVPKRTRYLVMILVALIHVALVIGLIRAFAPDFVAQVTESVISTFNVTITAPPPPPPPPPPQQPQKAGASAQDGRKAVPQEAKLPKPRIAIAKPRVSPPVTAHGPDNAAGASDAGAGTGAGGQGKGTGSGAGGNGQGGGQSAGAATKAVKVAGEINAKRDLPSGGLDARQGDFVNVALTVAADGSVKGCRVFRPSRDANADQAVCRLAIGRFRFRPALDRTGNPVESIFGWQQRYCARGGDCTRTMR
jgi:protein TonB